MPFYRILTLCTFFFINSISAQDDPSRYAAEITEAELHDKLAILASDALEGRATGTRGQKMAAALIKHHFEELGLKGPVNGDFYQRFTLYKNVPGEVWLRAGGEQFNNFDKIVYYGKDDSGGEISMPVVYVGKGQVQDYSNVEVANKGVVIFPGADADYRTVVSLARSKNARMVFVLSTDQAFQEQIGRFEELLFDERLSLNKPSVPTKNSGIFFISSPVAEKIFKTPIDKLQSSAGSGKAALKSIPAGRVTFKTTVVTEIVETENVLGYLEGSETPEEVIVITAHYDHIGKLRRGKGDRINNGADDDASGTSAVLQMATAFAKAKADGKGPKRSILFMTVAAEETGLLGSEYYTLNPVFPLEKTVVNLNLDMIGRRDEQHQSSPPYVYVIGSDKLSTELHEVNEEVNEKFGKLIFDYTYNDEGHPLRLYYRSDHWNFAQRNIPIIFFFDGLHEDYHLPSDETDKIEFDLLKARTQCVFHVAWEIANREERIMPDQNK